jgi:hypothetical protein
MANKEEKDTVGNHVHELLDRLGSVVNEFRAQALVPHEIGEHARVASETRHGKSNVIINAEKLLLVASEFAKGALHRRNCKVRIMG